MSKDTNSNIPATWRWARRDKRYRDLYDYMLLFKECEATESSYAVTIFPRTFRVTVTMDRLSWNCVPLQMQRKLFSDPFSCCYSQRLHSVKYYRSNIISCKKKVCYTQISATECIPRKIVEVNIFFFFFKRRMCINNKTSRSVQAVFNIRIRLKHDQCICNA